MLYFTGPHLALAIEIGIITGILSLTVSSQRLMPENQVTNHIVTFCICKFVGRDCIAVGRTFASPKNYQVDGNKEMIDIWPNEHG